MMHRLSSVENNNISSPFQHTHTTSGSAGFPHVPYSPHTVPEVRVYIHPPSESLICPLHKDLFKNPVICKCGHTFCRQCIVQKNLTDCPLDKTPLRVDDLIPNLAVHGQISDILIHCRYGTKHATENGTEGEWLVDPDGCPAHIRLGNRGEHEDRCEYAPAKCPYSPTCPPLRRSTFQEHVANCPHIPCPHRVAGCTFEGSRSQLDDHLTNCGYESIKDYIQRNEEQLTELKAFLENKMNENELLRKGIAALTSKFDQLTTKLESKNAKFESQIRHLSNSLEATQSQLSEVFSEISNIKKVTGDRPMEEIVGLSEPQLKCKGTLTGHAGPVWALTVTTNMLISGSSDTTIKVWDIQTFKTKQTLQGHEGIVHALAVIGNRLFSGSSDKTIRVWDLETWECVRVLTEHDNTVCALVVASGHLFSGSYGHIKMWDLETYECVQTLKGLNHWVRAITVSGGYLYSGSYNVVKIWDLTTFQCIKNIQGPKGSIYALAVAGKKILAGTYENSILVFDLDTYETTHLLGGHVGAVYTLAVMGNRFFSGSYDSTIRVWNLETFNCVQTLNRHTSSVDALIVYHGSLFTGSADNSIKVWR
eukprot:TRINITY_DN5741_c0_g1_i1.p1 TRINITY_DN5741_c0_g1~~TRINITY_DN5741_c0_g1_i1.p1  ORF type:complete len:592 (-),score=68.93 TRINITY_DN5741_c0_g1_i1:129-1904(-)